MLGIIGRLVNWLLLHRLLHHGLLHHRLLHHWLLHHWLLHHWLLHHWLLWVHGLLSISRSWLLWVVHRLLLRIWLLWLSIHRLWLLYDSCTRSRCCIVVHLSMHCSLPTLLDCNQYDHNKTNAGKANHHPPEPSNYTCSTV